MSAQPGSSVDQIFNLLKEVLQVCQDVHALMQGLANEADTEDEETTAEEELDEYSAGSQEKDLHAKWPRYLN